MKITFSKKIIASAVITLGLALPTVTFAEESDQDIVNLRIVETTDIHANIVNFDYYKGASTDAYGLSKAASIIEEVRGEVDNSLLLDNGDLIQGSPLGDYVYNNDLMVDGYVHPVYKAMNLLNFDAATVGNHEFNYGLEFLDNALKGANFPYVNANVYDTEGNYYFTPYEILEREVKDTDGEVHTINIGVTGFVPQGIMNWDAKHLEGKLVVEDIVKSAEKVVPDMKEAGADIVVVLSHSGIAEYDQNDEMKPYEDGMENASYYLSQVEGIDAILSGHQHLMFPNAANPSFPDGNGIDNTTGTINGIPTLMPGSWGNNIGLIDLTIEKVGESWDVTAGEAELKPITTADMSVEPNQAIIDAVQDEHEETIKYMESPVGELKGDLNTYFGLVKDNAAMEILNRAQIWYVENALKGTEYEGIPVISAAAPFKAGRGGVDDFTDVKSGTLVLKNIADLYLYDNNVVNAMKLDGAAIKEWLEWSAGQFHTIDPSKTEAQQLINTDFPTYNFDVIDGVTYEVDVTSPPKYDKGQNLINPDANRIKNLKYNGEPVTEDMEFIVATNDYRAAGSPLMNPGGVNTILKAPDSNRQAMMNYVVEMKEISASVNNNWTFTPIDANVTFISSPNAAELADLFEDITYTGETNENGFGIYQIDLTKNTDSDPEPDTETKVYSDVPENHWAKDYIYDLVESGVMSGQTETMFGPNATISREDFASLLELSATDFEFNGEPSEAISRSEMVTILVSAYEAENGAVTVEGSEAFTDIASLSSVEQESIQKAYELGFINGYGSEFRPENKASRAEAAKVIYLLSNLQ